MSVTRKRAEKALALVIEQNKVYTEPLLDEDGSVLIPAGPLPVLVEDYDGGGYGGPAPFAIVWEDGPSDWALRVHDGGPTEEERVLFAEAAQEFGADARTPKGPKPVTFPKGVFAEPIFSFALGLYPA